MRIKDRLKGFMRMGNKEIEAVVTYQFSKMLTFSLESSNFITGNKYKNKRSVIFLEDSLCRPNPQVQITIVCGSAVILSKCGAP